MMFASMSVENIGTPPDSSSRMICSRIARVRSSPVLASCTWNTLYCRTSSFTSASVMYVDVSVSYSRRFGYFLMMRGEAMGAFGGVAALHQSGRVHGGGNCLCMRFKYFILLLFGVLRQCRADH